MDKRFIYFPACLLVILGCMLVDEGPVTAADCKFLRSRAQKETSLLKKRDLLKQAVTECPQDPVLNYSYGKTLERLRKYEEAIPYYKIATQYESTRAEAFFGMGDIYVILSKPQQAAVAFEKGLATDPTNERAKKSLEELRKKYNIKASAVATAPPPKAPPPESTTVQQAAPAPTVSGPDLEFQTPFKE